MFRNAKANKKSTKEAEVTAAVLKGLQDGYRAAQDTDIPSTDFINPKDARYAYGRNSLEALEETFRKYAEPRKAYMCDRKAEQLKEIGLPSAADWLPINQARLEGFLKAVAERRIEMTKSGERLTPVHTATRKDQQTAPDDFKQWTQFIATEPQRHYSARDWSTVKCKPPSEYMADNNNELFQEYYARSSQMEQLQNMRHRA
jgi:hypothetical protein